MHSAVTFACHGEICSGGANSKRLDTRRVRSRMSTTLKSTEDISNLEKRLKSVQSEVTSIKELSDEQLKLKRVSNLITVYEKIVEGNYIDRLIKAQ